MAANYAKLEILQGFRSVYTGDLNKPLEFGRQRADEVGAIYMRRQSSEISGRDRIAIADSGYNGMSRQLLLISPLSIDRIRVENLSKSSGNTVEVEKIGTLEPLQARELTLPVTLTAFDRRFEITPAGSRDSRVMSMNRPTLPPGDETALPYTMDGTFPFADNVTIEDNAQLLHWLSAVTRVLQSALVSVDFDKSAAKEIVDLIGLDSGRVLRWETDGRWAVEASFHRDSERVDNKSWIPISRLMHQVTEDKCTSWTCPGDRLAGGATESTKDVLLAVASPLLDPAGNVIGALYGERRIDGMSTDREISQLEAVLVETLARGVAAGRARVEQQRAATTARVRFEQFFTSELSRHLADNPDLLTRRDTEVTLLFCDIRQFSSISERLDAEITMEWLRDVMETMAECAAEYEGTLVDYIGDELMVMWGAPASQPDHATRACRAALKMARHLNAVDERWRKQIGQPTQLGFGINTGDVRVGNVGFERKFRYAPFGNSVNIASRVQGATKYLGATVIATEATYRQLREEIPARRLCSVRVLNILEPIALYELCIDDSAATMEFCREYERGLRHYEAEELPQAIHAFSEILRTNIADGPTQLLLSRAVERLIHSGTPFDPVVELPGK